MTLLFLVLAGCGAGRPTAAPGTPEWLAQCSPKWDDGCPSERQRAAVAEERQALLTLQDRARFELQCAGATATVLEHHTSGPARLVGVSGCDRQAIYERRLRRDGWTGKRTTRNTKWERRQ